MGKKAIFFGGEKKDGYSSKIDIYDDETKEWTNCLMKGNPLYRLGATVVGKKAVFFCASHSPKIDIYDGETGGWTTHTASEARHNPAIAMIGKKVILFGGKKFSAPSPKIDIYDAETGSWTPQITSKARKGAAVAVVGKKAIFFGGMGEGRYSAQIDIYDDEKKNGLVLPVKHDIW